MMLMHNTIFRKMYKVDQLILITEAIVFAMVYISIATRHSLNSLQNSSIRK